MKLIKTLIAAALVAAAPLTAFAQDAIQTSVVSTGVTFIEPGSSPVCAQRSNEGCYGFHVLGDEPMSISEALRGSTDVVDNGYKNVTSQTMMMPGRYLLVDPGATS